jgi:hypothetical protein
MEEARIRIAIGRIDNEVDRKRVSIERIFLGIQPNPSLSQKGGVSPASRPEFIWELPKFGRQ